MNTTYTTIASYVDKDGSDREVGIDVHLGRYRVLDFGADVIYLVDVLIGRDDLDSDRAIAIANDYAGQVAEYLKGKRDDLPLVHPLGEERDRTVVTLPTAEPAAKKPTAIRRPRKKAEPQGEQGTLLLAA